VGALVLYNHDTPSTPWPGACSTRRLSGVWPLARWLAGDAEPLPLVTLQGRPLLAVAGIAVPERFFTALEAAGLTISRMPMPDHHAYTSTPWPRHTQDVITTEKDAVKLARLAHPTGAGPAVWVVGLDLKLPDAFVAALVARLAAAHTPTAGPTAPKGRP
jgi:tetraacyldisaccharide 4'-kinase